MNENCEISVTTEINNFNNISIEVFDENITNCKQCWHYKQICVKSHLPPTPIKIDLNKEKCVEQSSICSTFRAMATKVENIIQGIIPGESYRRSIIDINRIKEFLIGRI